MGLRTVLSLAVLFGSVAAIAQDAVEPNPIRPDHFNTLHRMIKPQPGELRFHDIPWELSIWEARKKAAAEGKPIFIWSGSGGAPVGSC